MRHFLKKQLHDWPLLAKNYANLRHLLLKSIFFNDFGVKIQVNPERIYSSAAKIDDLSMKRPCFLCPENHPPGQGKIDFYSDYDLLINPYPVFSRRLAIAGNRKGILSVERDVYFFSGKRLLKQNESGSIYCMENYLRKCFICEDESEERRFSCCSKRRFRQNVERVINRRLYTINFE
jgi:hypothetical protein